MPHPLLIFSQSDYLIQVVDTNSHTQKTNSADPDQLASEADRSGSTYTVCKGRAYLGTAGPGLT